MEIFSLSKPTRESIFFSTIIVVTITRKTYFSNKTEIIIQFHCQSCFTRFQNHLLNPHVFPCKSRESKSHIQEQTYNLVFIERVTCIPEPKQTHCFYCIFTIITFMRISQFHLQPIFTFSSYNLHPVWDRE